MTEWLENTKTYADLVVALIGLGSVVVGVVTWFNRQIVRQLGPILEHLEIMRKNQDNMEEKLNEQIDNQREIKAQVEAQREVLQETRHSLWIVRQHQLQIGHQVGTPLLNPDNEDQSI